MTALQKFSEKLLCEEETSDQQRSILLVDIMNALGFSKCEREIHRHHFNLWNALLNSHQVTDKSTRTMTGSQLEGMCGGIYNIKSHHDCDLLLTSKHFKLCTPRGNNINNPPLLVLHVNEEYDAFFFVEEDDNFPGYIKLSLAKEKSNYVYFEHCIRMNEEKLYLASSRIMDIVYEPLVKTLETSIPVDFQVCISHDQKSDMNGPAYTIHNKDNRVIGKTTDIVHCIHLDMWPNSANSFITRRKPNNWPSNSMLENIQSQGCDIAPVGHRDSKNNDIQWRISFPGERSLLLDLNEVQILCYALIKIILRENLNTSQREVVSSFHVKHVVFWCVELCSCQWVDSNYINCLNICLTKLIQMIKDRHIPHYILESRNLFYSKMTEKMSKEIVDVLSKYNTTHVFTLDAFDHIFKLTHYNNALLKRRALISTIMACFNTYVSIVFSCVFSPSYFLGSYIPHNATTSLSHYVNILQNLTKVKGVAIEYAKYFIRSMIGFLYYVKYKESNKMVALLTSKRLIKKSLNLDSTCVKLRAATFFLTNMEYSKSIKICDTFLTCPPRQKLDSSYLEYVEDIMTKSFHQIFEGATTEEIENIMKAISAMLYCSVKLKCLPGSYDITEQNPVWIFRNFTNILLHGLYLDVIFTTTKKWMVPDPILYELCSLPQNTDYEVFPFSGIYLDPKFVSIQTKFVCYLSMGNVNGMAEMLTLMSSFITENTFTTQSGCVYLNMFAYCQIKAGHNKQSVKSILQSLRIFPSRYNTASGYLKIVLQILNSLSVSNLLIFNV
jgi:hypothetical protein